MSHSKFPPSSAKRWTVCTKSINELKNYPESTNESAIRGTNIHSIMESLLLNSSLDNLDFEYDDEMLKEAQQYVEYVNNIKIDDATMLVEHKVTVTSISNELYGTADTIIYNDDELHIIDLKTGLIKVDAYKNLQLMIYALGALDYLEDELIYPSKITLHIVQKNRMIDNISTYVMSDEDITFSKELLKRAINQYHTNPQYHASDEACQWCQHASKCEAFSKRVEDLFEVFEDFEDFDEAKSKDNAAKEYEFALMLIKNKKLINSFIKTMEAHLLEETLNGNFNDSDFKIIESQKRVIWKNPDEALKAYKSLGLDNIAPRKIVTPSQIKKLIEYDVASARTKNKFDSLAHKPKGDYKIVPITDRGKAIEIFTKDEDEETF